MISIIILEKHLAPDMSVQCYQIKEGLLLDGVPMFTLESWIFLIFHRGIPSYLSAGVGEDYIVSPLKVTNGGFEKKIWRYFKEDWTSWMCQQPQMSLTRKAKKDISNLKDECIYS